MVEELNKETEGGVFVETKTVNLPEDALVAMLKALPEDVLGGVFWKVMVDYDVSPLANDEKKALEKAMCEADRKETVDWEDIR